MLAPRLLAALLAFLAALAIASASATAAVRYASPTGGGAEPCNPAPCTLQKAVAFAADGDQVVVTPGNYTLISGLEIDSAISVGGGPGRCGPRLACSIPG